MAKTSTAEIVERVLRKMAESDKNLGLSKRSAYDVDTSEIYTDPELAGELADYNRENLERAGKTLGTVSGGTGGMVAGRLLRSAISKGLKKQLGPVSSIAGLVGGAALGRTLGARAGKSQVGRVTAADLARLDAEARRQALELPDDETPAEGYPETYSEESYPEDEYFKGSEVNAMPGPRDNTNSPMPARNSFVAPHITGDYGHLIEGTEKSLMRTTDVPPPNASIKTEIY